MDKPKSKDDSGFLTVRELAEMLRVSDMTIHRMAERGGITCYQIGRFKRFRWGDVQEFLERSRMGGKKHSQERGLFNNLNER